MDDPVPMHRPDSAPAASPAAVLPAALSVVEGSAETAAAPAAPGTLTDAPARRRRISALRRAGVPNRDVVVACRVDPETAEQFAARAAEHGLERATLLARLLTEELARPAPRRRLPVTPPVEVAALAAALRDIEATRGELREGHGLLTRIAGVARAEGDRDTLAAANATISRAGAAVDRIDSLLATVIEIIERADVTPPSRARPRGRGGGRA